MNMTQISGNGHIQVLTCDNINTSHLSSTTSNVQTQINSNQTQINDINTKTQVMSYNPTDTTTSLLSALKCYSLGFPWTNSTITQADKDIIIKIQKDQVHLDYVIPRMTAPHLNS
jgi:hypothetical protein